MKKLIATTLLALPLAFSATCAQWVVYDPVNNMQQYFAAAEIAKYIEMINNRVQQIQTLKDQITEFKLRRIIR